MRWGTNILKIEEKITERNDKAVSKRKKKKQSDEVVEENINVWKNKIGKQWPSRRKLERNGHE